MQTTNDCNKTPETLVFSLKKKKNDKQIVHVCETKTKSIVFKTILIFENFDLWVSDADEKLFSKTLKSDVEKQSQFHEKPIGFKSNRSHRF